jgi:four helix bundle protein
MNSFPQNNGTAFREAMMNRTRCFAQRVYRLCSSLPHTQEASHMRDQLFRCATSVAANYRAAHRAKSDRDYLNKLKICEEESDESIFWIEMIVFCGLIAAEKTESLLQEANEITAIIASSCITKRKHIEENKNR